MPTTFSNTLPFSVPSDITFVNSATEVKIFVCGTLLGAINQQYPVSIYITVNGNNKAITMREISLAEYTSGNTNNLNTDTVAYPYYTKQNYLHIELCSTAVNYRMTGWTDENVSTTCISANGHTNFYDVNNYCNCKVMIEQVSISGTLKWRMVARYSSNVIVQMTQATALCYAGLFCYYCN